MQGCSEFCGPYKNYCYFAIICDMLEIPASDIFEWYVPYFLD